MFSKVALSLDFTPRLLKKSSIDCVQMTHFRVNQGNMILNVRRTRKKNPSPRWDLNSGTSLNYSDALTTDLLETLW